jgi:hypothetical protein
VDMGGIEGVRWRGVLSIAGVESRPVEGRICGRQVKGMRRGGRV